MVLGPYIVLILLLKFGVHAYRPSYIYLLSWYVQIKFTHITKLYNTAPNYVRSTITIYSHENCDLIYIRSVYLLVCAWERHQHEAITVKATIMSLFDAFSIYSREWFLRAANDWCVYFKFWQNRSINHEKLQVRYIFSQ